MGKALPPDWRSFISRMLLGRQNVTPNFEVTVVKPSFLDALDALITKTEPRIVHNYFCWRIVDQMLPYLNQERTYNACT